MVADGGMFSTSTSVSSPVILSDILRSPDYVQAFCFFVLYLYISVLWQHILYFYDHFMLFDSDAKLLFRLNPLDGSTRPQYTGHNAQGQF